MRRCQVPPFVSEIAGDQAKPDFAGAWRILWRRMMPGSRGVLRDEVSSRRAVIGHSRSRRRAREFFNTLMIPARAHTAAGSGTIDSAGPTGGPPRGGTLALKFFAS